MAASSQNRQSARFGRQAPKCRGRRRLVAALALSALLDTPTRPAGAAPPPANAKANVALGPQPPASVPGHGSGSGSGSGSGAASGSGSSRALVRVPLPSYFTVELLADGSVLADGARLGARAELGPAAREAVSRGEFAGAVLFGDAARSAPELAALAVVLERAGFASVRQVGRSAPLELSALARAERVRAEKERQRLVAAGVIEGELEPVPKPSAAPALGVPAPGAPAVVELQSMGLHLAAEANREPHRRQMLKLFERNFGAFRRCHADVPEHTENASFGVDLLIPAAGGRAKVRETRTRLAGDGFRSCMLRAFQSIRFEPPPTARPEIVSYSVVFKPVRSDSKPR